MLPAGILAFMLPVEPEEGFYADPPIQRSKNRRPKYEAFILLSAAIRTIHTLRPQPTEQ